MVTLEKSTVRGNTRTFHGGGISNDGTLTIAESTIDGNLATNNGGGICVGCGRGAARSGRSSRCP